MKTGDHFLDLFNSNIQGQKTVQTALKTFQVHAGSRLKMGNLPKGMNPGIRSPGAVDLYRGVEHL